MTHIIQYLYIGSNRFVKIGKNTQITAFHT